MLYPTSMPLLTGLVLFGLSFLNAAAQDALGKTADDDRHDDEGST